MAKGFTQEYSVDFDEIFAPIAHLTSVHSLIAIATFRRWSLFQMDVNNAFLNSHLKEEVYMQPPLGLDVPSSKAGRLRWALYGLK